MGKNKKKKTAQKVIAGQQASANVQNSKTVTSLEDIATIMPPPVQTMQIKVVKSVPPEVQVKKVDVGKKEGYVLETVFLETGNPDYTRVLIQNGDDWDVINCYRPAITMEPGIKILYEPGNYNNRETVMNPMIIEKDTILKKLFDYIHKQIEKPGIEETSYFKFAKKFFSMNHIGNTESEKFQNFLDEYGVISIIGLLSKGRFIIQK